jgi:HlyD family secretion protein
MEDVNKNTEIELRSEDFNDVLGGVPLWILRWGITAIAIIIAILLAGSAIFKYPDTISSTITLTGRTPVAGIVAKTSGKLQKLYVENNRQVKTNSFLAVIENPAKIEDIANLKNILQKIELNLDTIVLIPSQQLQLGSLQSHYSSFYLAMSEYRQFKELAYHQKKIGLMKDRIAKNETYYKNMLRQKNVSEKQIKVSHRQYARDSLLTAKGVLSKEELERSYSQHLQSSLSAENMDRSIESLQIQLMQLYESLYDTEYQYLDKKHTLETQLHSLINQLKTEIETWEMTYTLTTPIDGKITFSQFWAENQNISTGDIVFNVVPDNQGEIIGKALLPTERSGKVKVGQKVNIRFANYPDNEYGIVRGYVKNISLIPSINGNEGGKTYTIDIQLPNGLITTYNKELPFLPEMEGQADIITDDITLLERFLLPLKKVITESL